MSCVLITGATGVIGSELVPLFLESDDCGVRLIIRADSAAHLQQRLGQLFAYWELDPDDPALRSRVEAFCGDVCRPRLGLDDAAYRRLGGEVTHIVHCAGNVKLNQPLDVARASAVDSVRHVVELARACQRHGQFCKLDAISTIGVAGRMQGLIPERPLTEPRQFHNTYEQAKAEAEQLLLRELDQGLPLTIHRPSMVVGDSQTGRVIRFQVFYYLCEFLSGKKTWGIIPDTGEAKLDIIPVDHVARAIHIASGQPDTIGRIFHLCSGPEGAVRLTDLAEGLREIARAQGGKLPRLRWIPRPWFRGLLCLATYLSSGTTYRALRSLPSFLAYLDEAQSFDITRTAHYFSKYGLTVPPADGHLEQLLGFCRRAGLARQGASAKPNAWTHGPTGETCVQRGN